MVPPSSVKITRVPTYLIRQCIVSCTGLSPILPGFPSGSTHNHASAGPRSLAATNRVSIDVLSSGYLDVSVPRVRSLKPMYSASKYLFYRIDDRPKATTTQYQVGCPIRKSQDQSLFSAPPGLSQSITSFIASYCQGIHQTPFSRLI